MRPTSWSPQRRDRGFTLIEVIGALVIFSMGVLMVIQVSGALGTQVRYAAARSEIAILAGEQLDSIEATPFDSVSTGTTSTTITVEGLRYRRRVRVRGITAVLYRIDVRMIALDGDGPSYDATSYHSAVW